MDIDPKPRAFEDLADTLDGVAGAKGGQLKEDTGKRRLTYTQGDMTLVIDLAKGKVKLSFETLAGLETVSRAQTIGFGWREPSPMLPPPHPADSGLANRATPS